MVQNFSLVAFGAVLGANIRFVILKKLQKIYISKYFSIVIINTLSSFFLGLFISILSRDSSSYVSEKLTLFISIGFLGSFSTFSTFIYDLFDSFLKFKLFRVLKRFLISLSLGIIALVFGLFLGNL